MKLIDTETPDSSRFARTSDGKIDFNAYVGLEAFYHADDHLVFKVRVTGARQRFGHLDLNVTPMEGAGERGVELKTLQLPNAPAVSSTTASSTPVVEEEEVVELVANINYEAPVVEPEPVATPVATVPAPAPVPSNTAGTHWTEVAPTPSVAVATQEVVETTTTDTDLETQVENILNEESPVIK